jgi:hypothetical protein
VRRTFTDVPFAHEGVQTGDGRVIAEGAWYTDDGPWPLRWAPADHGGHGGAVTLPGQISSWRVAGEDILASGWVDDELPGGAELAQLIDSGAPLGVSVDLDDVVVEVVDTEPLEPLEGGEDVDIVAGGGRVRARVYLPNATMTMGSSTLRRQLATTPAGVTAAAGDPDPTDGDVWWRFSTDEMVERFVRARGRGATVVDMPAFADIRMRFDDASTEPTEPADEPNDETAETPDPDPVAASGGQRTAPNLIAATGTAAPAALVDEIERALDGVVDPPMDPPADWLRDPRLSELTPITIEPEGRVFGHICSWSQCHTGFEGECVLAPRSSPGLPWFNTGVVVTDQGTQVACGQLTIGGGHADITLSYRGAMAHYDNVGTAWADVVAGEDEHGVWVAGALRPGLSDLMVRSIRASSPSGDWRGIAGRSELVACHCVNVPGYPVARVAAAGPTVVAAGARAMRAWALRRHDRVPPQLSAAEADLLRGHARELAVGRLTTASAAAARTSLRRRRRARR